jgi:hypothetical protein
MEQTQHKAVYRLTKIMDAAMEIGGNMYFECPGWRQVLELVYSSQSQSSRSEA